MTLPEQIETPALSADETRLLHTYKNGPRIWDAASIFPLVLQLHERGLITSADEAAYALTDAGRARLAA